MSARMTSATPAGIPRSAAKLTRARRAARRQQAVRALLGIPEPKTTSHSRPPVGLYVNFEFQDEVLFRQTVAGGFAKAEDERLIRSYRREHDDTAFANLALQAMKLPSHLFTPIRAEQRYTADEHAGGIVPGSGGRPWLSPRVRLELEFPKDPAVPLAARKVT